MSLIFSVSIFMLIISGWLFFYQKSNENNIKTKDLLEQYQKIISSMQVKQSGKHLSEHSLKDINNFINKNTNVYGSMAGMLLAKYYVNNNQLDKATSTLRTSLKYNSDINFKSLIMLRLARIQIEQNKLDEAIKTLDNITDDSWTSIIADVRGEALFSKGEKQKAREEWKKSAKTSISPIQDRIINMKINK
ncbi:YfgM family protein [Pantoea sp. SoEX]|uniref:YfgM family protein n=1 Tax=Pantoea sp. SoEX TaxID=2576763 RepID=UPI0013596E20|nr:tetratricopeptide repeat protein [Pantoea sp. SoEX]